MTSPMPELYSLSGSDFRTAVLIYTNFGLMKSSDHIFILKKIHSGLSSDTAVYLRQQGCRNLNEINSPEIGCRGKSGHVPHDTAAKSNQQVFSVKNDAGSAAHIFFLWWKAAYSLLPP